MKIDNVINAKYQQEFWTNECTIEELYYDLLGVKIEATALDYFGHHKTFHYRSISLKQES